MSLIEHLLTRHSVEYANARAEALADAARAKEIVSWFMHPEAPVSVDPLCFARVQPTTGLIYLNEVDATAPKGIVDVEDAEER